MEFKFSEKKIEFDKVLNSLDQFVIDFTSILNNLNIKYVLVSGYVSILFGRARASEDIDIIIEKIDPARFKVLWNEIYKEFECIITENPEEAYGEYLLNDNSIRFSRKGVYLPNMEVKFPKTTLDFSALQNKLEVRMNGYHLFVSPLEQQIAFKLMLGSDKDIEDARHLYKMFKDKLDIPLLLEFNRKIKVVDQFNKYIK